MGTASSLVPSEPLDRDSHFSISYSTSRLSRQLLVGGEVQRFNQTFTKHSRQARFEKGNQLGKTTTTTTRRTRIFKTMMAF